MKMKLFFLAGVMMIGLSSPSWVSSYEQWTGWSKVTGMLVSGVTLFITLDPKGDPQCISWAGDYTIDVRTEEGQMKLALVTSAFMSGKYIRIWAPEPCIVRYLQVNN